MTRALIKKMTAATTMLTVLLVIAEVHAKSESDNIIVVENGNNSGPGSLRAAFKTGATKISIAQSVVAIKIATPLFYSSTDELSIVGQGQVIDASQLKNSVNILTLTSSAAITIKGLSIVGNAKGVNLNASNARGGKGIFIYPFNVGDSLGDSSLEVSLEQVSIMNVNGHGLHITDCLPAGDCEHAINSHGRASAGSINVNLQDVTISNVGFGKQDADGVRVDERGAGSINLVVNNSQFMNIGADGIELDEADSGDVIANVVDSRFIGNGEYCNLIPFVSNGPCDDGGIDLDDGFDIDEQGAGNVQVSLQNLLVSNNLAEGLDFDERAEGDLVVNVDRLSITNNGYQGLKLTEKGKGDVVVKLAEMFSTSNNGDGAGIQIKEGGKGSLDVMMNRSTLLGGDQETLKLRQAGQGQGALTIFDSNAVSLDSKGVSTK